MEYSSILKPFNDFWLNCSLNSIFSIAASYEPSYRYLAYLNDYRYIILNEKNFGEILMLSYYPEGLEKRLTMDSRQALRGEAYHFKDEDCFLEEIKELLLNNQMIAVGVDLFYWIPDSILWQTHHTDHYALITGFDTEKDTFFTFEDDYYGDFKKYEIPAERFKIAFKSSKCKNPPALLYKISNETKPYVLPMSDVTDCARRLMCEIAELNIEGIWRIDGKKNEYGIVESSLWGLKTIINRHKGNQFLFTALKELKLISDDDLCEDLLSDARMLHNGWTDINNLIIRYKVSDEQNFDVNIIYDRAKTLLEKEIKMWKKVL